MASTVARNLDNTRCREAGECDDSVSSDCGPESRHEAELSSTGYMQLGCTHDRFGLLLLRMAQSHSTSSVSVWLPAVLATIPPMGSLIGRAISSLQRRKDWVLLVNWRRRCNCVSPPRSNSNDLLTAPNRSRICRLSAICRAEAGTKPLRTDPAPPRRLRTGFHAAQRSLGTVFPLHLYSRYALLGVSGLPR